MAVTITSLILFLIGLALGGGGIRLAMLGGSWYYIIVGLAFLIAAWLLYRRRSTALWLYAAIVHRHARPGRSGKSASTGGSSARAAASSCFWRCGC